MSLQWYIKHAPQPIAKMGRGFTHYSYNSLSLQWYIKHAPQPIAKMERGFTHYSYNSKWRSRDWNFNHGNTTKTVSRYCTYKKTKKWVKLWIFSYPSAWTLILVSQKNSLIEKVLLSTHNICFEKEIRKIVLSYALLSKGVYIFDYR